MNFITKRPFYTTYAAVYDKIIQRPIKSDCDFIEKYIHSKLTEEHLSLLDVGCGTGGYSIELFKRGFDICAIDISKEQIEVARQKADQENITAEFFQADIFNHDFDHSYNVILCRGVLNDIIDIHLRKEIFYLFNSLLHLDGLLICDVRDWENSVIAKSLNPLFKKKVDFQKGTLEFVSETVCDHNLKQLQIKETHTIIAENKYEKEEYDLIMQCSSPKEIVSHLLDAGFKNDDLFGDYNFGVQAGETEKIIAIAQV